MDFGLAGQIGTPDSLNTASGTIWEPRLYAPEQVRGKRREITGRSDIYSLGVFFTNC